MRLNTCVIFGGKSVEHEVSIITGSQVIENINKIKYNPIPIYVSKENQFYYSDQMNDIAFFSEENFINKCIPIVFIKSENVVRLYEVKKRKLKLLFEVDLVILTLHGINCEDGTFSAYFEMLNLPYVGSNILASSIGQNKVVTKIVLKNEGVQVIDYRHFTQEDVYYNKEKIMRECETLGYPLIVKPVSLGSSVGVSQCDTPEALLQSIDDALLYDHEILIEKAIVNIKEYNCAVLGNKYQNQSSDIEEVIKSDKILSYNDKYLSENKTSTKGIVNTKRLIPADISQELKDTIKKTASHVFETIGNSGVIRIDFIYDLDDEILYVNEVNTIPGSLAYYLWDNSVFSYSNLLDQLIESALNTYKKNQNKITSYETNILSLAKNQLLNKLK